MAYPNNLAYAGAEDAFTPFQLFAGDTPAVATTQAVVLTGQNLAIFTVVQENAAGKIVVWDAVTGPTIATPIGIMAQPINASAADVTGPIYVAGHFNEAALVWPASVNTVALRRAAFYGTPIVISALL